MSKKGHNEVLPENSQHVSYLLATKDGRLLRVRKGSISNEHVTRQAAYILTDEAVEYPLYERDDLEGLQAFVQNPYQGATVVGTYECPALPSTLKLSKCRIIKRVTREEFETVE